MEEGFNFLDFLFLFIYTGYPLFTKHNAITSNKEWRQRSQNKDPLLQHSWTTAGSRYERCRYRNYKFAPLCWLFSYRRFSSLPGPGHSKLEVVKRSMISGAMCSTFSSIRGSFLEFCWGGCCHWQGRAGSIYWDCQTSQKQKWSPSGDVTTFESFGFCSKASFTIYVGRRWSLRIKIGIKEGIIRLPTISFYQIA